MRKLFFALIIFFPNIAFAECEAYWDISTLTNSPIQRQRLEYNGKIEATIPTEWFRKMREVKQDIDSASGIYTKLLLCNDKDPNAFAANASGQNMVMLTLGMYELVGDDWDVYAALLGHENAHLVHGHGQQREARRIIFGILQLLAGVALEVVIRSGTGIAGIGTDIASLTNQAFYASYSREDELEADRSGMTYAYRTGYDPNGAVRLHKKLASASSFLSSHPSSNERIQILRSEIALLTTSPQAVQTEVASFDGTNQPAQEVPSSSLSFAPSSTYSTDKGSLSNTLGSGVVVVVKSRLGYFIASQTDFKPATIGMSVYIETTDNRKIFGTVERVVGEYFSVVPLTNIDNTIMGKKVVF